MSGATLGAEDDLLAAEFALGFCDDDERRLAARRVETEAAFADACRRWQRRGAMMLPIAEEVPRPSIWSGIEAALTRETGGRPAKVASFSGNNRWGWRAAAIAASIAAIFLGALAIGNRATSPPTEIVRTTTPLVAVLTGAGQHAVLAISFDRGTRRLSVVPAELKLDGRSAELWVIPVDGRPHSLGTVANPRGYTQALSSTIVPLLRPDATVAVSVEPQGGSPTGQPTGPVILTGKISAT